MPLPVARSGIARLEEMLPMPATGSLRRRPRTLLRAHPSPLTGGAKARPPTHSPTRRGCPTRTSRVGTSAPPEPAESARLPHQNRPSRHIRPTESRRAAQRPDAGRRSGEHMRRLDAIVWNDGVATDLQRLPVLHPSHHRPATCVRPPTPTQRRRPVRQTQMVAHPRRGLGRGPCGRVRSPVTARAGRCDPRWCSR